EEDANINRPIAAEPKKAFEKRMRNLPRQARSKTTTSLSHPRRSQRRKMTTVSRGVAGRRHGHGFPRESAPIGRSRPAEVDDGVRIARPRARGEAGLHVL